MPRQMPLFHFLRAGPLPLLLLVLASWSQVASAAVSREQAEQAIGKFDALAPQLLTRSGVPGMAVAIVAGDEVLYERGFGVRRRGAPETVDADTVFQLASVSKPLTSTVIAGLVGDEVVKWETPVVSLQPNFALSDPWVTAHVTIGDLLSHRSGLPAHAGDLLEDLGYSQAEVLRRLRCEPLSPFRISYAYTNFGFTEAALATAAAVGKPWADVADERLFKRLGMNHSSFRYADYLAQSNRATLHAYVNGIYLPLYQRDADAQAPAGGASASVSDLAAWLRLQLNEGRFAGQPVISAKALHQSHLPQAFSSQAESPADRSGFYGYGWNVGYDAAGRVRLGHSGAFMLGAATAVTLYPGAGIGIIVLTNGAPYGLAEATAASFFDILFEGDVTRDWLGAYFGLFSGLLAEDRAFMRDYGNPPENPVPPLAEGAYYGVYHNPYFGYLLVYRQSRGLTMWLGPNFMPYALSHWDGNQFTFETSGENALGISGADFSMGAGGRADAVVLERYNKDGMGTFRRLPDESMWDAQPSCADLM